MYRKLVLDDRIFAVQTKLYIYLRQHNLHDVVRQDGVWTTGPGRVMVNALLAGAWPREYKEAVRRVTLLRNIVDDPYQMFGVLQKLGGEQSAVQKQERRRASVAAGGEP